MEQESRVLLQVLNQPVVDQIIPHQIFQNEPRPNNNNNIRMNDLEGENKNDFKGLGGGRRLLSS